MMVSIRYTYEVAPVFTLMEDAVLKRMMEMIGWEEGGDGLFNPGTVPTPLDLLQYILINKVHRDLLYFGVNFSFQVAQCPTCML